MTPRAAVYVPEAVSARAAVLSVAGRPAIVRILTAALRAGFPSIGVPRNLRPDIEEALRPFPEVSAAIEWLSPATPPWVDSPVLLLPATALVDVATLKSLADAGGDGGGAMIAETKGTGLGVVVAAPDLVAMLWRDLTMGEPLGAALEDRLRRADVAMVPGGLVLPVIDGDGAREAEAALYARLGVAADSPVDRYLHRRCSPILTRLLVRWPVTPNQVTLASLGVGLAAATCLWRARSATMAGLGLLLYSVSVVIDHSDGEVARLTFQESTFGERLDFACDTVVHAAIALAMGATARREASTAPLLGAAAAGGVVLSALVARFLPSRHEAGLGSMLRNLGNRDGFYSLLGAFVVGLGLSRRRSLPWVMALLAAGSQAYWIAGLVQRLRERSAEP
jgi:phosphatidylglycerophosphate synthase